MIEGKLKHSMKERCPICGARLQTRQKLINTIDEGIEVSHLEDYIACSSDDCDYTQKIEQKRKRRKENAQEVDNGNSHIQRRSTGYNAGRYKS